MKKIECVIRPEKLKELTESLRLAGIGGMTIAEVKGFGSDTIRPEAYLVLPKTKVEIYVADDQVEEIVSTVIGTCRSGELGDGKIAILPMDDVVRVRTGERKEEALF